MKSQFQTNLEDLFDIDEVRGRAFCAQLLQSQGIQPDQAMPMKSLIAVTVAEFEFDMYSRNTSDCQSKLKSDMPYHRGTIKGRIFAALKDIPVGSKFDLVKLSDLVYNKSKLKDVQLLIITVLYEVREQGWLNWKRVKREIEFV